MNNFTILINSLINQDGDLQAAQQILDFDMPAAGIEPDDLALKKIKNILKVKQSNSYRRTSKLKNLYCEKHGKKAAEKEYQKMKEKGLADAFQYGWAMQYLCKTPEEVQTVLKSMSASKNGVMPDVSHFNILIQSLLHFDIETGSFTVHVVQNKSR